MNPKNRASVQMLHVENRQVKANLIPLPSKHIMGGEPTKYGDMLLERERLHFLAPACIPHQSLLLAANPRLGHVAV
jgi:hypothetical protein